MKPVSKTQNSNSVKATNPQDNWVADAHEAARRIPPLWPLKHFVAVNPFLEMIDRPFGQVAAKMASNVPGGILIGREFFQAKRSDGSIRDEHLEAALEALQKSEQIHLEEGEILPQLRELKDWLVGKEEPMPKIGTLADAIDKLHGSRWATEVVEEISNWLGAYLDEGQALWQMPWKDQPLYQAWKEVAATDRSPELLGIEKFRSFVAALPDDAEQAILYLLEKAGMNVEDTADWLHRELLSVGGWAACLKYRERSGQGQGTSFDLLAIRLAFDVALLEQYDGPSLRALWRKQVLLRDAQADRRLLLQRVWQEALELAYRESLLAELGSTVGQPKPEQERPAAQMVFCIDVRSEPMRRAIEAANPKVATYGFAGFFGMPIEAVPFTQKEGAVHCPVILDPPFRVREGVKSGDEQAKAHEYLRKRGLAGLWKGFKDSAVSCFSFVEAAGVTYGWNLLADSFGLRKEASPSPYQPILDDHECEHSGACGIPLEERIKLACGVVKALNLNVTAAPLVALCGHGASTTNNPYDSGLQCGACGGHSGDFNSKVAAEIMNDPAVRAGLEAEGLKIPDDTWFLAGRHDTTLDRISFFNEELVPETHRFDLESLKSSLVKAGAQAGVARAPQLGIDAEDESSIAKAIEQRATDWSQVRPEWGLAGNAAFIVAPRESTQDLDLGGRAFLHHYDAGQDPEGALLGAILGGPMVVGTWINLQYFASAANHEVFGSGHKTLHNVNGTHGIQLGNGGDLKTGLPWQSIHDGEKFIHEPVRLHVMVDAPEETVRAAVVGNESVKHLVENHWVHLFAADGQGGWTALN